MGHFFDLTGNEDDTDLIERNEGKYQEFFKRFPHSSCEFLFFRNIRKPTSLQAKQKGIEYKAAGVDQRRAPLV